MRSSGAQRSTQLALSLCVLVLLLLPLALATVTAHGPGKITEDEAQIELIDTERAGHPAQTEVVPVRFSTDGGLVLNPPPAPSGFFSSTPKPLVMDLGGSEDDLHDQGLQFECPPATDGYTGSGSGSFTIYGCPLRVYDAVTPGVGGVQNDYVSAMVGWLFGNVQLAVHPDDPSQAAFFSLHGEPTNSGRTEAARQSLTHTTFTTTSGGLSWEDQPTGSGNNGGQPLGAYGEWASGVIDQDGKMTAAYLWNTPKGRDAWDSAAAVFKAGTVNESRSMSQAYSRGFFLDAREDHHVMTMAHLAYVGPEEADPLEQANDTGPREPGEHGEAAVELNETDQLVLVWHEEATDWQNSTTGMSGWIDMMWSHTNTGNSQEDWTFLDDDSLIGPCKGMSDLVVWDRQVYVACIVEKGYTHRSRAFVGDVDMFRLDLETGKTEHLGFTGIQTADHVRMASSPDGYFAVAGSRVVDEQRVEVEVSMGWYGQHWNVQGRELGPALHDHLGGVAIRDAHVTGLAVTEDEKTVFMTYKEWNDLDDPVVMRPEDPVPRLRDYKKIVVSMNECFPLIAGAEFRMGELYDSHQYEMWSRNAGMFNDRQDGLQYTRLADGQERVMVAINDYGAVQYAGIIPSSGTDSPCGVGGPPPPPPASVFPQAVAMGSAYNMVVGTSLGLVSLAMIGYLLSVRRKSPLAAATKDR